MNEEVTCVKIVLSGLRVETDRRRWVGEAAGLVLCFVMMWLVEMLVVHLRVWVIFGTLLSGWLPGQHRGDDVLG